MIAVMGVLFVTWRVLPPRWGALGVVVVRDTKDTPQFAQDLIHNIWSSLSLATGSP